MEDPLPLSIKQSKHRLIGTSILLIAHAMVLVAAPWPLKIFFDRAIDGSYRPPTWLAQLSSVLSFDAMTSETLVLSGLFAVLAITLAVLARLEEVSLLRAAFDIESKLRNDLVAGLFRGRLLFFENRSPEELAERVCEDTAAIGSLVDSSLRALARAIPTLLFVTLALALIEPVVAFAFGTTLIPFSIAMVRSGRKSAVHEKRAKRESEHFQNDLAEALTKLPGVKAFELENATIRELEEKSLNVADHLESSRSARGSIRASVETTKNLMRAAVAIAGGLAYARGAIESAGTLILLFAYIEIVTDPIVEIGRFFTNYKATEPARERLSQLTIDVNATVETEGAQDTSSLPFFDAGVLHFNDVVLPFNEAGQAFNAEIEPGELIAVVGSARSGRTNLGRVLNRLSDLKSGAIQLGRNDLKRFTLRLLRETVTVVEQAPYFLQASVRENLEIAAPDRHIEERDLNEALNAAGVDDIGDLPSRLETVIGHGGFELSAIQSRRLQLTRAFLRKDSRVFYFDETTLDLPTDEARSVYESLRLLTERGAIVFWVTRRLDEANEADRVLYLASGSKPRLGLHEELLVSDERYRRIFGVKLSQSQQGTRQNGFSPQPTSPEQSV